MECEACRVRPARRYVVYREIMGAFIVFFTTTVRGDLCQTCIHRLFWRVTIVTLLLGWWGVISFFLTPVFVFLNLLYYIGLLGMESPNGTAGREFAAPVAPAKKTGDEKDECYLCGKALRPEERDARVCSACRE
jgi:hypothetical protein